MAEREAGRAPVAADRRSYGVAMVLLAVGGALLIVAYGMPWGSAAVPLVAGMDGSMRWQESTGRVLFPAAAASGWVGLAGIAGIVATRGWGRPIVATFVLAAGLAGVAAALLFALSPSAFLNAAQGKGVDALSSMANTPTLWWLAAAIAGLEVAAIGAWTLLRGRRWPALNSRFDRTAASQREMSAWQAQDVGRDPTDDLVE